MLGFDIDTGAARTLLLLHASLERCVQHLNVVVDPGRESLEDELASAVLHLGFHFGEEGRLEHEEEHSLFEDLVFVAETEVKLPAVAAELGPLLPLLLRRGPLKVLILPSDSI